MAGTKDRVKKGLAMATNRTTENRISAGINEQRRLAICKVNRIGIPMAIAASVICPVGIPVWAISWYLWRRDAATVGSPKEIRGAIGEERVLSLLSRLPAGYSVFNQIKLPAEKSSTGYREADYKVVGPNGCFIIENKCNPHLLLREL
jgi:hypothetical protein